MKATIKVVLAIAIALPVVAFAQFSRWTTAMHVDGLLNGPTIVSADGSTLIAMRSGLDPLRSVDGGVTWTSFTINGQPPGSFGFQITPTNAKVWYGLGGTDGALYQSMDGGNSWTKRTDPMSGTNGYVALSANPQVLYRAFYDKDPNCVFNEGCFPTKSTWQVSSDGGIQWGDFKVSQGIMSVYPSPVDPSLVFAIGPDGMTRSRDAGATWTVIVAPSPNAPSGVIAFDRFDAGLVYLTPASPDDTHGFVTHDAGTTWSPMTVPAGQIVADPIQEGRAFLFTYFDGAYETRDAGAAWVHVEPSVNTSINYPVGGVVMRAGKRFAVNAWDSNLRQLDLNDGALALGSDLWWNPAQSGWGMSITHHSSTQTFVAWFAYDRDGNAVWRIIPGGQWNDRTFTGDIYQTTGPPYFGATFDTNDVVTRRAGSGQIAFDDDNNATFSWQLDEGLSGNQPIVREEFGVPAAPLASDSNFADLWWNPNESGWGISISHQYDNIFAAWYVYDAKGNPLWVVMPDAKVRVDNAGAVPRATGVLYTTQGPSALLPFFDPSKVALTAVGSATLTFLSTGQMRLDYNAFGHAESKVTVRQPF